MPFAESHGLRIHYEIEGDGTPLTLQHGLADDLNLWYEAGYVEALKSRYRLILIDARGHGDSDKPHELEAYAPELNVADVLAVLDDLSLPRAHFWGYSMGGSIGFALAALAPTRTISLVLGGATPATGPHGPMPSSARFPTLRTFSAVTRASKFCR